MGGSKPLYLLVPYSDFLKLLDHFYYVWWEFLDTWVLICVKRSTKVKTISHSTSYSQSKSYACIEITFLFTRSHSFIEGYNLTDNNARWLFFYTLTELSRALQHINILSTASLKHSAHKYGYFQFDCALSQPNPLACNARVLVNKAQHSTQLWCVYCTYGERCKQLWSSCTYEAI